jgi:CBS domain-containing protein
MPSVREILKTKGSAVLSIGPRATALDAAVLMNGRKVGSLLVMDGQTVLGIVTERDLLQRVLAARQDPDTTLVEEVMTAEVLCCRPETTIEDARTVMKDRRLRHLPVVDDQGQLHGLISIGDLNAFEAHGNEMTIHVLTEYIHGRA